ncbi:MAG: hypothetical protein QUV06_13345 [Cyanobium sp. CZS 48M]|nr:hypothetical protein [Cyanobium sp. CZS48M]
MRFTVPLALATATAFSVSALPVRAFPGASVNLMRVNGDGVTALPGLQPPSVQSPPTTPGTVELISQASGDTQADPDVTVLQNGTEGLEIQYNEPLPQFSGSEYISLRNKATGDEVERIFLNSDRVRFSSDRRTLTINPESTIPPGEVFCALLPDGPGNLPSRTTPCCLKVAVAAPAAYVAPAGNPFPWWIIPVGLGLGVGICAIAGCFDGGGGGGGSGNVSR